MPELPGRRGGPSPSSSRHRPDTRESRDRRHNSRPITGHERRSSESPGRKRRRSFEESRRRSASPDGAARDSSRHRHRPRRRRHSSRERRGDSKPKDCEPRWDLPYSARSLGKADLATFEPLFIHYLAVQKQREARDMDEREFRGRWRSFIGKWNRGELAEGWYDPDMFSRISSWVAEDDEGSDPDGARGERGPEVTSGRGSNNDYNDDDDDDDDDADDYGPTLPQKQAATRRRVGAEIPTAQDLSLRDELILEDREEEREALRAARRADRTLQRERLEELAPRAEPGTHERRMEKRREAGERSRQFRRDRSPGMDEAANDADLLGGGGAGGGGDSLEELKRLKLRERRKKSERELRREELDRAKREMMEARRRQWQEREEGTVSMLRELAKQRFG